MGDPVGVWDWWDLGGCFHGEITGNGSHAERGPSAVSSGRSVGRDALAGMAAVFTGRTDGPVPQIVDLRADGNVEIVSKLLDDLRGGTMDSRPGTIVLPPGSVADGSRFVSQWPIVEAAQESAALDALRTLGREAGADWPRTMEFIYERFGDHWAAGVAFHS